MPNTLESRPVSTGLFMLTVLAGFALLAGDDPGREVAHRVRVPHPGLTASPASPQTLIQHFDRTGRPVEYYYDTESVFCHDGECKIVTVRLVWDEVGLYKRYELARGVHLEKAEGRAFTAADHKRLHQILSDRNSPLKAVIASDIKNHEGTVDVDGISGATPVLYKGAAVEGAAWSCFTLWHWANGEMCPTIQRLTAATCTVEHLITFLDSKDVHRKAYAIRQLTMRAAYDPSVLEAVHRQLAHADRALTKLTLHYFEQAPTKVYYRSMKRATVAGNSSQRVMAFYALLETDHIPPPGSLDQFSHQLTRFTTYQEVDLMLRLMKSRNASSSEVVTQAFPLLGHNNFLVARRAYWFLRDQPMSLSASQQQQLESFRLQHGDKL